MIKKTLLTATLIASCFGALAGVNDSLVNKGRDTELTYIMENPYEVEAIEAPKGKRIKNVILMIGDGMSLSHVASAWAANRGHLWLENAQTVGLSKTWCADRLITDSGAGGTALASGSKTSYHAVGVDPQGNPLNSLNVYAHRNGLANGVTVTCRLWDATPADFLCHNADRDAEEAIMADYVDSPADVVIGPGFEKMTNRADGRDLLKELKGKGYGVYHSLQGIEAAPEKRIFCTPYPRNVPEPLERGNWLEQASMKAINILDRNPKGFFLMIEGSQLDDYGHFNDIKTLMEETHDFDRTIGAVMKWAANDGETLVVVVADHETGGLTLVDGDKEKGKIVCKFSTGGHSGVMVPVYAFGPGHEHFSGIMENTDIPKKIMKLLKLKAK